MNRLLLIDDDKELCEMLGEYLEREGFTVTLAHDGNTGLEFALRDQHDLIVLDVMMPEKNGLDVLRELRTQRLTPVLMLTARDEDVDSIVGLELGADDYLAKPCNPRVLVARVRAILRRAQSDLGKQTDPSAEVLVVDDLHMHSGSRTVSRDDVPIEMTSTEFSVLQVLLQNAGQVLAKSELSELALGRALSRYDRSLDMHVSNLRRKLGSLADGEERIKTVRGVGYLYTRR